MDDREIPFDISKETLKSIREWLDKLSEVSIGFMSNQIINPNDCIVVKYKMVQQLIVLATPLLEENDLEAIEDMFSKIEIKIGRIKIQGGWKNQAPMYSIDTDKELDKCTQKVQTSLKKYFKPTIREGERY